MGKLNSNIKTIFFDAGGVLFDTEIPRSERIRKLLTAKGFDDILIENGLNKGEEFSKEYLRNGKWLTTWSDEETYWDQYYEAILKEITHDFSYSLKKQLLYHTHYVIHCKLFSEVRNLLDDLSRTYKLGVISNALPSMDWVFDTLDIRKYFDSIIISAFAGVSKPDEEIYKIALNSLNADAEECAFIDDKIKNVETADRLGFLGIHLDRKVDNLNIVQQILNEISLQSQKCI
jgi:putative hydrolase of the HAD superfamily